MVDDPTRRVVLKLTGLGVTATMGGSGLASARGPGGYPREGAEPGSLGLATERFGIELDNGRFDVEIGEDRTFDLFLGEEDTLFFKFFSLQTGDEPLVPAFEGTILDRFPDTGVPGEGYTSVVALSVAGTTLNVERTVTLDPEEARFSLDYTIHNVGAEPVPDLKLHEFCDYTIGFAFQNVGVYENGEDDLVYVKDVSFEDTNIHAGFSGEEPSEEHHVASDQTGGSYLNGRLNNEDRFPDSGSGQPVVALQWALGDLPPGESTSFTVQFGAARSLATLRELVADEGGDLEELIDEKRALVDDIRTSARPLVTAGKAATIDEAADSLLAAVEDREFGDDDETVDQYEEALERVLGAEQVTETATRRPKPISEDIARAVAHATYVGGVEAATLGLGELGVARRVINSLLDFIGDTARGFDDVVTTFRGADEVAEVVTTFERRVEDLFESNPGAVEAAAESIIEGFADDPESFEGTIEELVPEDAFETLVEPVFDAVEESNELLAEAIYQQYYFEATLNDDRLDLPSLDELEEAVNTFEVDFPSFLPDFDLEVEDLDLPGGEPVDDAVAYLNSLPVQLGLVTGIDPVLEREIGELEDGVAAGDLAEVDDDVREALVAGLELSLDVFSDAAEVLVDFFRGVVDLVAGLEFVVALGIVVAGASAIASGGATTIVVGGVTFELFSVLATAAFNLAVVEGLLAIAGALVGSDYLVAVGKLHEAATVGLLDDVGDVSAFGAGGG